MLSGTPLSYKIYAYLSHLASVSVFDFVCCVFPGVVASLGNKNQCFHIRISSFNDRVLHDDFQIEGRLEASQIEEDFICSLIYPPAAATSDSKKMFRDATSQLGWSLRKILFELCRVCVWKLRHDSAECFGVSSQLWRMFWDVSQEVYRAFWNIANVDIQYMTG